MGIFKKQSEPIFLKETSNAKAELDELERIFALSTGNKADIERRINIIRYGLIGENNIEYELRNSHLPIYVIHDLYLEKDGLTAQIDYMVFAPWRIYVIECKNLIGNIEINSNGAFIRSYEISGIKKKEGIYSPITQNRRHLELIRKMVMSKQGFLSKLFSGNYFDEIFKSLVVLSNPKNVLNDRYAKKEIKQQVLRADRLVEYIREDSKTVNKNTWYTEKALEATARSYLTAHVDRPIQDFSDLLIVKKDESKTSSEIHTQNEESVESALRAFRLEKIRAEKVKPYFIFNNAQMEEIIKKRPKDLDELIKISGFGEVKCQKYGKDILIILNR